MRALRTAIAGAVACGLALAALTVAGPGASAEPQDVPRAELAQVRAATARFHDVHAAEAAGYELLDICFDSSSGGMGIHYLKGVDADLDPLAPEALVYEVTASGPKLVAVEYIVPAEGPYASQPPATEVLGDQLHAGPPGLWVRHAWVWKPNPDGMFADFNPNVGPCPSS